MAENIRADPWTSYVSKGICVDRIGDRTWRERYGAINQAQAMSYLAAMTANVSMATDGSLRNQTTVWCSTQDHKNVYEWCAGKEGKSCSFRAEAEAFEDALEWMKRNTSSDDNIIVWTDSIKP